MAEAPLTLRLAARKPRTVVGEGIVLDVAHQLHAELEMETVDLNRGRTEVLVSALDGGEYGNRVLTGEDYMVLHRHPPLTPVGTRFVAPAESAWTVQLELCKYARPLPAGKYRIEVTYRWGQGEADVVHTDPVTVEILPATVRQLESRWLGGANARERLSSLWIAETGDGPRWVYQQAMPHDPSVPETASDLTVAGASPLGPVQLAHLNDIAPMHWERFACWREQGGMGFVKVTPYGRSGAPGVAPLELLEPRLVEPPLQNRANVLQALWVGAGSSGPAALWMEVDREGKSRQRTFALPGRMPIAAAAAWTKDEESLRATLFLAESGELGTLRLKTVRLPTGEETILRETEAELVSLEIDQWMGFAWVHLLTKVREKDPRAGDPVERLEVARWSFEEGAVAAGRTWNLPLAPEGLLLEELRQSVSLPDGGGLALLFQKPDGWIVCTEQDRARISPPADAKVRHPHLASTPAGLCFVFHEDEHGFSALPVFERRG
jgi:hypothetical protein